MCNNLLERWLLICGTSALLGPLCASKLVHRGGKVEAVTVFLLKTVNYRENTIKLKFIEIDECIPN